MRVDERHSHIGVHAGVTPGSVWKWRLSAGTCPPRASPLPACPLAVFEPLIPLPSPLQIEFGTLNPCAGLSHLRGRSVRTHMPGLAQDTPVLWPSGPTLTVLLLEAIKTVREGGEANF